MDARITVQITAQVIGDITHSHWLKLMSYPVILVTAERVAVLKLGFLATVSRATLFDTAVKI